MPKERQFITIAGVNKAGTTSLFTYLSNHPEICSSSIKETCYFLPLRYRKEIKPFEVFLEYFSNCENKQFFLESTPGYFYGGETLVQTIKESLPGVKIIIILRDPVDRLISFYRFKKNQLELPPKISIAKYIEKCKSFNKTDFIDQGLNTYFGIEGGKYIDYIRDWELIKDENILIVDFNELKNNPKTCLISICNWLNLENIFYNSYNFKIENKSVSIKNKSMQKLALRFNKNFESYLRENQKLKNFVRKIYYKINGSKNKEEIDKQLISELELYYKPYNQKLLNYLIAKEKTDIPQWLRK